MYNIDYLQDYLLREDFSQMFILTDENTSRHCLPILLDKADILADRGATLLEIDSSGEANKNFDTVISLCNTLLESKADRHSVLLTLGGGVVTDIGSFVASIYKRGIQNLNIPTSLLAMVDASIGYKTGINLGNVKNAVGTFNRRTLTFIDTDFLHTLPHKEILNGISEMLKTFLVLDKKQALGLLSQKDFSALRPEMIYRCIELKEKLVEKDPYDLGERRLLNFGHTIGHALEVDIPYKKDGYRPINRGGRPHRPHGEAVAIGMFYALRLSQQHYHLDKEKFAPIYKFLKTFYNIPHIDAAMIEQLLPLIYNDKKTLHTSQDEKKLYNFTLLEDIGKGRYNIPITATELLNSF